MNIHGKIIHQLMCSHTPLHTYSCIAILIILQHQPADILHIISYIHRAGLEEYRNVSSPSVHPSVHLSVHQSVKPLVCQCNRTTYEVEWVYSVYYNIRCTSGFTIMVLGFKGQIQQAVSGAKIQLHGLSSNPTRANKY